MSSPFHNWLNALAPASEIFLCGVQMPDETILARTWSLDYSVPAFKELCPVVVETFQMLRLNQLPSHRIRMVYEQGLVHACQRADGTTCILLTSKTETSNAQATIESLLAQFESLPPPAHSARS